MKRAEGGKIQPPSARLTITPLLLQSVLTSFYPKNQPIRQFLLKKSQYILTNSYLFS